jgi:hypothetical protein
MAVTAIGAAVTLYAANEQAGAAEDAADAQRDGANAGIAEQRAAREQFQQNIDPYLQFGQQGIDGLQGLLADPNSIQDSAAYQWQVGQGINALDRSASAGGALGSGGHQVDLLRYGQGLASQEYGNQWARLAGIAQMGQNSAVGAGQMGQQSANAIGNLYGNIGQAGANQAANQSNAWRSGLQGLAGIAGDYFNSRQSSFAQPAGGSGNAWGAFTPNGGVGMGGSANSLIANNNEQNSLIWGGYGGLNGWRG